MVRNLIIFLSILGFIALIIFIILMLPVYIIFKTDENGELIFRYKFLNKTYGENPDPNNPVLKTIKKASGISRLEKENLKKDIQENSFFKVLKYNLDLIVDVFKILLKLLKQCTAKTFKLTIVCAEGDAAERAISYGQCCAVTYPVIAVLHNLIKFKDNSEEINISCDYEANESVFTLDILLEVRVFRVIGAIFRAAYEEAQRDLAENNNK